MRHILVSTACGWVGIEYSKHGVHRLTLPARNEKEAMGMLGVSGSTDLSGCDGIGPTRRQVTDYFSGKRHAFDCKLDLWGSTPFQRRVWTAIMEIPYGQVRSYKWVAEKIGQPSAFRAVGRALATNPLPALIPCHRVIRSDGKPGGFGGSHGNVETKLKMLLLEGYRFRP